MRAYFITRLLLAGASVCGAGAAFAEPFNGPYVGVHGGWQQERLTLRAEDSGSVAQATLKTDGLTYGAHVGYDFKLGEGVLGIEAAIGGTTGKFEFEDDLVSISPGRTIELVARGGALIGTSTLIYARGGYANIRLKASADGDSVSENRGGWTAGAGIEHAVSPKVSARIEYVYSKWNSYVGEVDGTTVSLRPSRNALKAGFSFRF